MGITFDEDNQVFIFDFEHDGADSIINLKVDGYQIEAFGKCFYYGYEFNSDTDTAIRSDFIKYLKFSDNLQDNPNLTDFIKKAIDTLSKKNRSLRL